MGREDEKAARVQALDDVGIAFEGVGMDFVRARQAIFVEEVEIGPQPDAVAVVAPREVALALRRGRAGAVRA